jgi:beta-phosphoglucomutase-like phosphatase (HAD superfamily)
LVETTVGMEDVPRHKPAPDVFVECARRLGVAVERCLVFEDAPAGIEAALSGGMKAVAVLTHHPVGRLAGAVAAVDGLWSITAADCAGWLDGA